MIKSAKYKKNQKIQKKQQKGNKRKYKKGIRENTKKNQRQHTTEPRIKKNCENTICGEDRCGRTVIEGRLLLAGVMVGCQGGSTRKLDVQSV